jgi:hypothetical protein
LESNFRETGLSKIFIREIRAHRRRNSALPLRQFFLVVGGALLMVLFVADAVIPRPPPNESSSKGPRFPVIRINSELKGPEPVVIDTNRPAIVPKYAAHEDVAPAPQTLTLAKSKGEASAQRFSSSREQTGAGEPKKAQGKQQPTRKLGRARSKQPATLLAKRSDFGFFDGGSPNFVQPDLRMREAFAQFKPQSKLKLVQARVDNRRRRHFEFFDSGW